VLRVVIGSSVFVVKMTDEPYVFFATGEESMVDQLAAVLATLQDGPMTFAIEFVPMGNRYDFTGFNASDDDVLYVNNDTTIH
jgi:hypothetical protein